MHPQAALIMISGLLLGLTHAQLSPSELEEFNNTHNPSLDILTCDALPCAQNDNSTICWPGPEEPEVREAIGVGMIPNVLNITDSTNLSITLIDGYPIAGLPDGNDDSTTRTLYVGAPPDTNLSSQRPGCMLMMQYQATTFPYKPYTYSTLPADSNTTTCPTEFLYGSQATRQISSYVRDFEYTDSDEESGWSRCEALASYVEFRLRTNNDFPYLASYYANSITLTGGPLTGPSLSPAQIPTSLAPSDLNPPSCQPVQPANYQLYNVTSAMQLLRDGLDPEDSNMTIGGRTGFTPLVSVLCDEEGDGEDPEVQLFCVHVRRTDGAELSYGRILTSGGSRGGWSLSMVVASVVAGVWPSV